MRIAAARLDVMIGVKAPPQALANRDAGASE